MKVGTALVFVCVGVYIAFNYPDVAQIIYAYSMLALNWIKATFDRIAGGGQ